MVAAVLGTAGLGYAGEHRRRARHAVPLGGLWATVRASRSGAGGPRPPDQLILASAGPLPRRSVRTPAALDLSVGFEGWDLLAGFAGHARVSPLVDHLVDPPVDRLADTVPHPVVKLFPLPVASVDLALDLDLDMETGPEQIVDVTAVDAVVVDVAAADETMAGQAPLPGRRQPA
jgi:hypothetical protein